MTKTHNFHRVTSYCVVGVPRLPLIEDLTTGPIPLGSQLLVEYDPASQWYNASLTITAGWLMSGGTATYNTLVQPPEDVRSQLKRLGVDTETLEKEDKLKIFDYYTVTLGQKSKERYFADTVKVADESIEALNFMKGPPRPGHLFMTDDDSTWTRFSDEKAWVELELTRLIPGGRLRKVTQIFGVMVGIHSDWAYKRLEAACEGVVDFKLEEADRRTRSIIRIRNMRNVGFDSQWHPLRIADNFEVTLEK